MNVTHASVSPLRLPDYVGEYYRRRARARGQPGCAEPMFGQPSSYSLTPPELAAHIRSLRKSGWQHWEITQRFDFRSAA